MMSKIVNTVLYASEKYSVLHTVQSSVWQAMFSLESALFDLYNLLHTYGLQLTNSKMYSKLIMDP